LFAHAVFPGKANYLYVRNSFVNRFQVLDKHVLRHQQGRGEVVRGDLGWIYSGGRHLISKVNCSPINKNGVLARFVENEVTYLVRYRESLSSSPVLTIHRDYRLPLGY
jgi:hypothetical protein